LGLGPGLVAAGTTRCDTEGGVGVVALAAILNGFDILLICANIKRIGSKDRERRVRNNARINVFNWWIADY
jgi:hypothetical protein